MTALAGCGGGADTASPGGRPTVVVTTSILGDVTGELIGDAAEVVVIMPPGSDPHDFEASAQQVDQMRRADALITNGGGFEVSLAEAVETARSEGVPTHDAIGGVETIDFEEGGEGVDPHFFTDPSRMADAAADIVDFLTTEVPALAVDDVRTTANAYVEELRDVDASVQRTLSSIPDEDRIMITNHEVFGYFADRYDFEVVGVVIPAGSTGGEPSAGNLADLVGVIEEAGAPAIFADTSAPTQLAETLASESSTGVDVVELFSESLGEPGSGGETYVEMVRSNADRIAAALG
ncbi:zinc ABC transporter substrate-binding protein [Iamia sp. SCSIO 61187]|uniref:metal ABC transporter substrate-binding protein n=1 Tax=Iamia sp. SCSIO 61187 TaxID=2722752 RepID=UPI001C62EF66|nr:metal ABC transporter substrate-binding protein [Iamia sp. SCSIO 61187]QYG94252.1 zinc ABC transporter substrate-binding protein [Iamia sp. SCSIO 61187]